MTNQPGKSERTVGNTFGLRTWIEYGLKQAKDDLGWADYRLTEYATIERWGELVMSAYTLVSLQSSDIAALGHLAPASSSAALAPPPGAPTRRPARRPSRLGHAHRLDASPQQPPAAPAALCLCLSAPPLARIGPAPARPGGPDRPRCPRFLSQHLPLSSPNMTEEGISMRGSWAQDGGDELIGVAVADEQRMVPMLTVGAMVAAASLATQKSARPPTFVAGVQRRQGGGRAGGARPQ
jgi:hypothetical protein